MTDPAVTITCAECVTAMELLGGRSVDVVIADPPYSARVHTEGRRIRTQGEIDNGDEKHAKLRVKAIDYKPLTPELRAGMSREMARVVRRWLMVFCDVEGAHDWIVDLTAAGLKYVRTMVWIKPDSGPQMSGDRPQCGYESIVLCHRAGTRLRWNGGGRRGVFVYNTRDAGAMAATGATKLRDGQKPIDLMLDLVRLFSDEGETILDPTMGAATTGIACMRLGRRFIGYEQDEACFAVAAERIAAESAQSTIEARRQGQRSLLELVR